MTESGPTDFGAAESFGARELPIFALNTVLLPGAPLPLHVFEQRYRRMVADVCGRQPREFVVLRLDDGDEVQDRPASLSDGPRPPVTAQVGTIARIARVEPLEDGRSFLLCVGGGRMRLLHRTQDLPYPAGMFVAVPEGDEGDDEPAREPLVARTQGALRGLFTAVRAAIPDGRDAQRREVDLALTAIPDDVTKLSYFTARVLSTATDAEKQRYLETPGPIERLRVMLPLLLLEERMALQRGAAVRAFMN